MVSFSFEDWSFRAWLDKNKDSVKTIVSACAGLGTAFVTNMANPVYKIFLGAMVSAVSRMVLDTIDYYLTSDPK
jgi:hypothetical protein